MPRIKYVCLSDLHLGEETSLLTAAEPDASSRGGSGPRLRPSPEKMSSVMERLVDCLTELVAATGGGQPTLILAGDILELALASDEIGASVFQTFIRTTMAPGSELFDRIVYVPGNHDHHLWETARETQYVDYMDRIGPTGTLRPPTHITMMFDDYGLHAPRQPLLTALAHRAAPHLADRDFVIDTVYPNFGLVRDDLGKCVVFNHGHFIEALYSAMSWLRQNVFAPGTEAPKHTGDLEEENFAWIDFFWSTMGRQGGVGQDIEFIHEAGEDPRKRALLVDNVSRGLTNLYDRLPWWASIPLHLYLPKWWLRIILGKGSDFLLGSEKTKVNLVGAADGAALAQEAPLSDEALEGLRVYLERYVQSQLNDAYGAGGSEPPRDVTFVFGHTHKPLEDVGDYDQYPAPVKRYNTGGWLSEHAEARPIIGGSVLLVSDDLDTVALRMWQQQADQSQCVRLETAARSVGKEGALYETVARAVAAKKAVFDAFSKTVQDEMAMRAPYL
jgi:hypothetical protein